jgi:twitching motility protein PilT
MSLKIGDLLSQMKKDNISDLILKVGSIPIIRKDRELIRVKEHPLLTEEDIKSVAKSVMSHKQLEQFEKQKEMDLAVNVPGLSRFRVNLFMQRGHPGIVFRLIPAQIPDLASLKLPTVLEEFAVKPRGLLLITGPSGCGKSTTIASIVQYINERLTSHIITVEDPIEFIYEDKKAVIDQRAVGYDTHSFASAVKFALRQDPDVIVVGEMRDRESIQITITAAETGHLVLSTLHTRSAIQTIDRIINIFPPHQRRQITLQLSANLLGIISQDLVKNRKDGGLIAVTETLISIAAVRKLVREGKTHQLYSVMQTRTKEGMQTLNRSIVELVKEDILNRKEAFRISHNPDELNELLVTECK